MELTNEIDVRAPVEEVWAVFNDVERIAPCLPGAQLEEIEGEEYRGVVKVKVGPITTQYKGRATFEERDKANWKVIIRGDGRDARGQGNASALITAILDSKSHDLTGVNVTTELTITGKVAQFGRGAIADVSTKLMDQFAENLQALLDGNGSDSTDSASGSEVPISPATTSDIQKIDAPEVEPVDLVDVAGSRVLKRAALPVGAMFVVMMFRRIFRGR